MLKKSALRRIIISSFALILFLIIQMIPSNIYPNNISVVYEQKKDIPVYLIDPKNYSSRINISYFDNNIEDIVNILTINNDNRVLIPIGFNAVIPENTKLLDYHIKDDILYLNFSSELLNVTKENEEKLIECLVYSLCELKGINGISLLVNNQKLTKLPNSGYELPNVLNYEYGINKSYYLSNLKDSSQVTVYYMSKYNDINYYVPITKITNNNISKIETIVSELKTTPFVNNNISSYLKASYELEQYEILENSIKLTFNNEILTGLTDKNIEEELKYMLTLSIRDTYNIEDVTININ